MYSLPEIESDLSVFHRIRNPHKLGCRRYLQLAELLPAYQGAVHQLLRQVLARHQLQQDLPDGVVRPIGPGDPLPDATTHPMAADLFG